MITVTVGHNLVNGQMTKPQSLSEVFVLIEGLIKKYPKKQIVLMTSISRGDSIYANGASSLSQYANVISKRCNEYGIPVLDAYNAPEMNLLVSQEEYIADRLHPSAAGNE
ncbi:MAG: SGNH/GDSL hydrolase family protein, partial [Lentisphaeria bacterium]